MLREMKIKLFTIPNILTLLNLFCGSVALIEILLYQDFVAAFILIIASGAFDFLDGMVARLLGQYSEIGKELDSLADLISFGLVPSVALFTLFNMSDKLLECALWSEWGGYLSFLVVAFSALRLAKFNVDDQQQSQFIGLPTPANAFFCLSIATLIVGGKLAVSAEAIAAISIVMSILLVVPIRLFALKFKSLTWRENRVRYIFIMVAALTLILLKEFALPVIIALYVLMSVISNIACSGGKERVNE